MEKTVPFGILGLARSMQGATPNPGLLSFGGFLEVVRAGQGSLPVSSSHLLWPLAVARHSHLVSIAHSPKIFQKTKCSICNSALELPSVHFLCGHSFHQHCFESYSESDADCPTCLPENRKVMDMIRAQEQKRDLHDQFQHQVGGNLWSRGGGIPQCPGTTEPCWALFLFSSCRKHSHLL